MVGVVSNGQSASSGQSTFVGLIRGINVGPSARVSMTDLRATFEAVGFSAVKTILQSGNVVFAGPELSNDELEGAVTASVEKDFRDRTGLTGRFILLSATEFRRISSDNPLQDLVTEPSKMMIDFLPLPVNPTELTFPEPEALLPEVIAVGKREIYAWCPFGVMSSRIPLSFWRQLGPVATTRNLNTVNRILRVLDERESAKTAP